MSIKLKVILSIVVVLILGTLGQLFLSNLSYKNNVDLITKKSLSNSRESFANLQKNDLKMMTAVIEEIAINPEIKSAFIARDHEKLLALTNPKYQVFKTKYGITQWNFMDADSENKMVLRLTMPKKFGDTIKRITLKNAVKTNQNSYGTELGNTGFAIRVVKPYYDGNQLIGFVEFGEEINKFSSVLKELTGNEYGLVLKKSLLKQSDWVTTREAWNQRNNWDDQKNIVAATSTIDDESFLKYDEDFETLPEEGKILDEVVKGDSVYIRGIFPIIDVQNRKVGGVFVLQNISEIYNGMKSAQSKTILFIIVQTIVICLILIFILIQLVFKRLSSMIDSATRVVGGDYNKAIVVKSNDEVGQFENLFEQFRQVFVHILNELQQGKKD